MSSIRFEQSVVIQRPLNFVYTYLSDLSHAASWDPNVLQAQKTTAGPLQVGTHFDVEMQLGWTELNLNYHISVLEPDRYLEFKGIGDHFSRIDRLRLEGDGRSCTLHYQLEVYLQDPLTRLGLPLTPWIRSKSRAALDGLKRSLEGAPSDWQSTTWTKLGDQLIVPGLWRFTRHGYRSGKSRWSGVLTDLSQKTVCITGATSGIGAAAARSLGRLGAKLIIVARHQKKAEHLSALLVSEGCRPPQIEIADLGLMQDVEALVQRLLQQGEPIHVLINNAGALFRQRIVSAEGVELSFATLLLAPYILTEGLLPLLRQAGSARVINVTSGGMYTQPLVLDDLEYEQEDYSGSRAYARAKRGLVDISEVWARDWQKLGITVHSMHPGWADTPGVAQALPEFYAKTKDWLRSPEQGADTLVWLAAAPEAIETTGLFWLDRTPRSTALFRGTRSSPKLQAALREKLEAYRQRLLPQQPPAPDAEPAKA